MMLEKTQPTFLFPFVTQFCFDGVCEAIVKALADRNFKAPNMEVTFSVYGTGEAKYRYVSDISGPDWRLHFCRQQQRTLDDPNLNDIAGISNMYIPQEELNVYHDGSGPTYYRYVGKDWTADTDWFLHGVKVNAKLHDEPRRYLKYTGSLGPHGHIRSTRKGVLSPFLVYENDSILNREYLPEGDDPLDFKTRDVMKKFADWIEENILKPILATPAVPIDPNFFHVPEVPFPSDIGPIFTFAEWQDAERIDKGKADPSSPPPADRYGMQGGGMRFVSLSKHNAESLPEVATDSFLWCGLGGVTRETEIESLSIPGHYRWSDKEQYVLRIKPETANGIYIADRGPYEDARQAFFIANPEVKRLTDAQLQEFECCAGKTIIPITEYKGGFRLPVVLIKRELSLDEVEIVSGPHPQRKKVR